MFKEYFGKESEFSVSVPGRVEIGGNHTDHQGGCVLAGAINLLCTAQVSKRDDKIVRIYSEGFNECTIDLNNLEYLKEEESTTKTLIKGVAKKFEERDGGKLMGFDAYIKSDIAVGSGLSSSAAFEVLIGRIFNKLGNYNASAVEIAKYAKFAENYYYGKPCGLMDQMACSMGGLSFMDFRNEESPVVHKINFNLGDCGYKLCVVNVGAGHENLTPEYASVPAEMKQVASCLGYSKLSEVDETEFYGHLSDLRVKTSDRAVLRAMHFFAETKRAKAEYEALKEGDFEAFLQLVRQSAKSSFEYLQNVIPAGSIKHQNMAFALCLCNKLLEGEGAVRVHGGGFAGSALAFVPEKKFNSFKEGIEKVLGEGSVCAYEFYG